METNNKPQKKKVAYSPEDEKHIKSASVFSIIPGLGQFYNKQYFKGILFLAIFMLFIIEMVVFGWGAFEGLITLGTVPREDHSLFIMIQGTLQVLLTLIFLVFYIVNISDARRVAKIKALTPEKINYSVGAVLKNTWNNGFAF